MSPIPFKPGNSISADNVSFAVRGKTILNGISLQVFQDEIFGIYGHSGAGKTSLLRIMSGLDLPSGGRAVIHVTTDDDTAWLESVPSLALESLGFAPELTVHENLQLFARLWGIPRRGRASRIARFLELLDLSAMRSRPAGRLSNGEKIRLELARTLMPESSIIMIDCLMETLTGSVRLGVWRHLQERAKSGAAVIVATSSAEVAGLCDRLAVLDKGCLAFLGSPEELLSNAKPDIVVIQSERPQLVREKIEEKLFVTVEERDEGLVFTTSDGNVAVQEIMAELGSDVSLVYLRRPDLLDVLENSKW